MLHQTYPSNEEITYVHRFGLFNPFSMVNWWYPNCSGCCCGLGIALRFQLLKNACLLHLIGDKAPPACLRSSPPLSVGFSMQDEAMRVTRSAPRGAHFYADVIAFPPDWELRRSMVFMVHQLRSRPTLFKSRRTTHPCVVYGAGTPVGQGYSVNRVGFTF